MELWAIRDRYNPGKFVMNAQNTPVLYCEERVAKFDWPNGEVVRVEVRDASKDDDTYLIWSTYHGAWWGPNRGGYYTDDRAAGRYTREEAQEIVDRASPDRKEIAVKLSAVREFARTGVSEGIK